MTNCQWIDSKTEAFFADELQGEEFQRFQTHLASCDACRATVESLKGVDSLVRGVFQRRVAVATMAARANTRPRVFKIVLASMALTAAAVFIALATTYTQYVPAPPVALKPPPVPVLEEVKKEDVEQSTNKNLSKPGDVAPAKAANDSHADKVPNDAPEFLIADTAGYTYNLETYRGRALLFGVISPSQKAAVTSLQQIYEAFGSNRGIRVLGIARHQDDSFDGATIPVFFNHGSKLMGMGDGQFLLVDASGKTRLQGSLSDARSIAKLGSQLEQMGIR